MKPLLPIAAVILLLGAVAAFVQALRISSAPPAPAVQGELWTPPERGGGHESLCRRRVCPDSVARCRSGGLVDGLVDRAVQPRCSAGGTARGRGRNPGRRTAAGGRRRGAGPLRRRPASVHSRGAADRTGDLAGAEPARCLEGAGFPGEFARDADDPRAPRHRAGGRLTAGGQSVARRAPVAAVSRRIGVSLPESRCRPCLLPARPARPRPSVR